MERNCENCKHFYECDNMGIYEECLEENQKYFEERGNKVMKTIPKEIIKKQERINKKLKEARELMDQIKEWAVSEGADTDSEEWYNMAYDDWNIVYPTDIEGIQEYFNNETAI